MPLHTIGAGNHQNRVVKHSQHSFGIGSEIHMPRRIKHRQVQTAMADARLMRMDGDATLLFHLLGIEECVAMVDAPDFAHLSRRIQQGLRQCGLAGIHVCHDACDHTPSRSDMAGGGGGLGGISVRGSDGISHAPHDCRTHRF